MLNTARYAGPLGIYLMREERVIPSMRLYSFVQLSKSLRASEKLRQSRTYFQKQKLNILFQIAETWEMMTKVFREVEHLQLKVISPCEIKSTGFQSDNQESKFPPFIMKSWELTTGELWKIPASLFADWSAWLPFLVFEPKIYLHIHPIGTFSFM